MTTTHDHTTPSQPTTREWLVEEAYKSKDQPWVTYVDISRSSRNPLVTDTYTGRSRAEVMLAYVDLNLFSGSALDFGFGFDTWPTSAEDVDEWFEESRVRMLVPLSPCLQDHKAGDITLTKAAVMQ